jgi:hypothetical protein
MERVTSYGAMDVDTMASTSMTRNKAMDSLPGKMADVIKDNGKTVSKMVGEFSFRNRASRELVFGVMVRR